MLSYRHAFHAGNFADVLKHVVLTFVLDYVTRKAKPLYVLDTHAGAGGYDLASPEATRTGEHRGGIARLLSSGAIPELAVTYLRLVRAADPTGECLNYPGSPLLAYSQLRPQDRLELAELHPKDHALLAARFAGMPRTRVTREDGLALLGAWMPPPERRAVVLIDPSYELKAEYAAVVRSLAKAHRRFASGIYLLWYPVIERSHAETLLDALRATGIRAMFQLELCVLPDSPGRGMTGSGMIVVNPPWVLPEAAARGLPWIGERLRATGPCSAA